MDSYGFVGVLGHDILLYLSAILQKSGKKILIVDYSKEQDIMNCINRPEIYAGITHYRNIDCCVGEIYQQICFEDYDLNFVFLSFDHARQVDITGIDLGSFVEIFIITDYRKRNIMKTVELLEIPDIKFQIIMRDICCRRFNKAYFLRAYRKGTIDENHVHELYFDEMDYAYRIKMEYEPFRTFKHLSVNFQELLINIAVEISKMPNKEVQNIYRKVKRGIKV